MQRHVPILGAGFGGLELATLCCAEFGAPRRARWFGA
jgi:hypothetical protein